MIAPSQLPASSASASAAPSLSASSVASEPSGELRASGGASKKCNCKRSRCLKMYCDCFAANVLCGGCKCTDCGNADERSEERRAAIKYKLSRNKAAFTPKFRPKPVLAPLGHSEFLHVRGCNCKRSGCAKKYCECYQAGMACSEACKCSNCTNDGSLPHLRNFGVYDWQQPHAREPTRSAIGVESLLMILPVAGPEEPPAKKQRLGTNSRSRPARFPQIKTEPDELTTEYEQQLGASTAEESAALHAGEQSVFGKESRLWRSEWLDSVELNSLDAALGPCWLDSDQLGFQQPC